MLFSSGTYRGTVTKQGKVVLLEEGVSLPAGTEVLVTLVASTPLRRGSPAAVLRAIHSEPHLSPEDVKELERLIQESRADVDWQDPLVPKKNEGGARDA